MHATIIIIRCNITPGIPIAMQYNAYYIQLPGYGASELVVYSYRYRYNNGGV